MAKTDLFQLDDGSSDSAFARIGIFGPTGSGKSTLLAKIGVGLHSLIQSKKPIVFFDTEGKYRCVRLHFLNAGIPVFLFRTRAFSELATVMQEGPKQSDILLIDQITHPYEELKAAKKERSRGKPFITLKEWQSIKGVWRKNYDAPYATGKWHIIWASRQQNLFEETEESEIAQYGVRPQTETSAGYEPDLLIQLIMKREKGHSAGYKIFASVVKDNYSGSTSLMGQEFESPEFKHFAPYFGNLALGKDVSTLDLSRSSTSMFDDQSRTEWERRKQQREAALEEVKELLSVTFGTGRDDKKLKAVIVLALFGTLAWDNEIVPDARKHPLEECLVAASAVRALVKAMKDPEFLKALTPESVEGWIRDFKVGGGAFEKEKEL